MTTIPKSLHTVTVLVKLAPFNPAAPWSDKDHAMRSARLAAESVAKALGYGDLTADMYGLVDKAATILVREVQS
jgi:hypothetical protein